MEDQEGRQVLTPQGELLETSLQAVVLHGEAFVTAFYERLFSRFPETSALFAATDMLEQRKKLQRTLSLIIEHLQEPDALAPMLRDLGWRHVGYGVQQEHYRMVGAVLLETFADFLGQHWTPAHHDAWVKGYEAVSSLMVQGAKERPSPSA
ncbi:MAG TPA: globin domain-containing protein [Ktedonobacterales bacterium]|jgi:hemoglobin-like flavoprotein|nr:globin domain-containing protein [Ktedonobacterales bacterium]